MEKKENDKDVSFYSDDSFEDIGFNPKTYKQSRFKNINRLVIPRLNFEGLPEYVTTDEEEGSGDEV